MKLRFNDAQLDRVAAAWHREFECWNLRRRLDKSGWEYCRQEADKPIAEEYQIVRHLRGDRIDAEAMFDTLRDRAAAAAALRAISEPRRRARR